MFHIKTCRTYSENARSKYGVAIYAKIVCNREIGVIGAFHEANNCIPRKVFCLMILN